MINISLSARDLGNLEGRINVQAQRRADRIATQAADEMLDEVESIIEAELINDRPANRRKRGMKIINSFESHVEGLGTPRVKAIVRAKPGARKDAIQSLDKGSDPHFMEPTGGEFLWMPKPGTGPIFQAYHRADKRYPFVYHPGTAGIHFLRRARERVLNRLARF